MLRGTLSSAQRVWRETNDVHYGMENMRMQLKMCNGRAAGPKVEGWSPVSTSFERFGVYLP